MVVLVGRVLVIRGVWVSLVGRVLVIRGVWVSLVVSGFRLLVLVGRVLVGVGPLLV